ncbi:hypothetical protein PMAYCL1PPCAC_12644, partial [Pristionchus mayeri]
VLMATPVEIRVRFFGKARELMACEEKRATIPSFLSYQELKNLLFRELYIDLGSIESACILAVDHTYLSDHSTVSLRPYSEVAIIPPLSGG